VSATASQSAPPESLARSAHEIVRARCQTLGWPTWRADTAGAIIAEPVEVGAAGAWLRSGPIGRLVTAAAQRWTRQAAPAPELLFAGCWLIPIPERHRRGGMSLTIVLSMGPEALYTDQFRAACASALLDLDATRTSISTAVQVAAGRVEHVAATLKWMIDDLSSFQTERTVVTDFTSQLTDAYETIDLLYTLGRSMNSLDRPESFVQQVADRLHASTSFDWVATVFPAGGRSAGALAGRVVRSGNLPASDQEFQREVRRMLARPGLEMGRCAVENSSALASRDSTQILTQPVSAGERAIGILLAGNKRGPDPQISSYDLNLVEAAGGYISSLLENAHLYAGQRSLFLGTIQALTASIDAKDRYTRGHSERVAHVASRLALAAGFTEEQAERVHIAGLVHDVGKIGVPEAVLCKAGRLSDEEFRLIRLHPEIGHGILKDIELLADILPGVLHHHERWDGNGYPHRLAGEQIPFIARLIGLADTFDAMSSTRSYRPALPREQVLTEIARCAGTQFDADLAQLFAGLNLRGYDELFARQAAQAGPIAEAA
jgi:HD-GYP domain-containing protein (c-di-GMP phosphodiesterase class II)